MSRVNDIGHYEVGNVFFQKHSENTVEAHANVKRGPLSDEVKEKLSAANTGKTLSEETKDKIRQSVVGTTRSPETREK